VESFARTLATLDAAAQTLANDSAALKEGPPATAGRAVNPESPGESIGRLRQLIDATMARAQAAGDQDLLRRATELRRRLESLSQPTRDPRAAPVADDRYGALLRQLRGVADPGVQDDVERVADLARIARQQAVGGIDPTAFDRHRQQTLQLLDAVQQAMVRQARGATADPRVDGLLARAAALRQSILAIYYGVPPDVTAARARFFDSRQIDRARVDSELDAVQLRLPAAAAPDEDQGPAQRRLDQLSRRLNALGGAPPVAIPADAARTAIAALLGKEARDADENGLRKNRCTLCHELSPGAAQLAPVRVPGGSLLVHATFTHEHHVNADQDLKNCMTCHTGILDSTTARDVNLPGIESCRSCHAPGKEAANAIGCESCHKYHALPGSAFMWRP
jgi:hypothetical protein